MLIICTVGHSSTGKVVVDSIVFAMPLAYLRIYSLFDNAVDNTNHVVSDGWIFFVVPFYLQSVLIHSANCVNNI
jgi:hypothetical protein